jgi:hypothetical protein
MDATAQLALMTKAKLVFETADTFLSFPVLLPLSYPPEKLRFTGGNADILTLSEFSRVVNFVPDGTLFQPTEEVYLWELYEKLFQSGEIAEGTASPAETAEYEKAKALLSVTNDGFTTDSPALLAYKQYRDAWFQATQEYNNGQTTAAASTDPSVKTRWQTVDEPFFRQKVQQAAADWLTSGFRAEVEEAQRVELAYAEKSPSALWTAWGNSFNPDTDTLTDANQHVFAPTGFSPSDIVDHDDWPTFRLASSEIGQLVAMAPKELKNILAPTGSGSGVDSISFQYRSVILSRPWLRPAVFNARFWRLPPSEPPLNDGGSPPRGRCPAYITGVVFAQNIVVGMRQTSGVVNRAQVAILTMNNIRPELLRPASSSPLIHPTTHVVAAPLPAPRPMPMASMAHASLAPAGAAHLQLQPAIARLNASTFKTMPYLMPHPQPPPGPTIPPTPPPAIHRDISILALICKRLPKCPDPDPALTWPR